MSFLSLKNAAATVVPCSCSPNPSTCHQKDSYRPCAILTTPTKTDLVTEMISSSWENTFHMGTKASFIAHRSPFKKKHTSIFFVLNTLNRTRGIYYLSTNAESPYAMS